MSSRSLIWGRNKTYPYAIYIMKKGKRKKKKGKKGKKGGNGKKGKEGVFVKEEYKTNNKLILISDYKTINNQLYSKYIWGTF